MSEQGNFEAYRALYERQPDDHSLEAFGITRKEEFERALSDPTSVVVPVGEGRVPVLTRLDHLSDRNLELYGRVAKQTTGMPPGGMYYYSHLPRMYGPEVAEAMTPVVRQLAAEHGVIAYDCATENAELADEQLRILIGGIGGVACQPLVGMPQHYHYMMEVHRPDGFTRAPRPFDFRWLYRNAKRSGAITPPDGVTVVGWLPRTDRQHLAEYYHSRHQILTQWDATDAGFSPASLDRVLANPRYTKAVYRIGGKIANMTLVADIKDCPWIDETYVRDTYPEHSERNRVLVGIGAISDPEAHPGLAEATFATVSQLIAYAGGDGVVAIATDKISNRYIPSKSAEAFTRAGLQPSPINAVTGVAFRAVGLSVAA